MATMKDDDMVTTMRDKDGYDATISSLKGRIKDKGEMMWIRKINGKGGMMSGS